MRINVVPQEAIISIINCSFIFQVFIKCSCMSAAVLTVMNRSFYKAPQLKTHK